MRLAFNRGVDYNHTSSGSLLLLVPYNSRSWRRPRFDLSGIGNSLWNVVRTRPNYHYN